MEDELQSYLSFGIAALSVTFFLAVKKKITKEKLPAAPASFNVSAVTFGVVAEPVDADFLGELRLVLLIFLLLCFIARNEAIANYASLLFSVRLLRSSQ